MTRYRRPPRRSLTTTLLCALAVVLTVTLLPATAIAAPAAPSPRSAELTQPKYSYPDAIRETAYVEAPVDGDRDGRNDRIAADIIRPKESASGLKVPVIMVASPYYARRPVGAQDAKNREFDPLGLEPAVDDEYKDVDDDGSPAKFPEWYDNYFVPRGYAVALVDMPGTRASEGCLTVGGKTEVAGVKAVVDWFGGNAKARNKAGTDIVADWSNGKVGMIGQSWLGSEANAVATLNPSNLKTIVPMSGISSWYNYLRLDGQIRFPDWPRTLSSRWGATRKVNPEACRPIWNEMAATSAEDTGNYNEFWAERDYAKDVSQVKASVLMTHGLNDWNVLPRNGQQYWQGLAANNVPRKLTLHQGAHVNLFQVRRAEWINQLHRWFDHWLYGIDTGIMTEPQVEIQRDPTTWVKYPTWPQQTSPNRRWWFGPDEPGVPGTLRPTAPRPPGQDDRQEFTDSLSQSEAQMIANPDKSSPNRLLFLAQPLASDMRMSGTGEVEISARVSGAGPLTALLVDYGEADRVVHETRKQSGVVAIPNSSECIGNGNGIDTGCFLQYKLDVQRTPAEIVAEGWLHTKHRESLNNVSPVNPNTLYTFKWKFQPDDYVFKAGHRLGVVIAGTDCSQVFDSCTSPPSPDPWPIVKTEVVLDSSFINLPITNVP